MTGRLFHRLPRFLTDQRGGVSAMLVLMMVPIIAVLGMATEASSWYLTQRAMQNAADSAAVAAASNTCGALETCHTTAHTPSFVEEAASVARTYGFTDGAADTTVGTVRNPCPADATQVCYWVTITRVVPINLTRLVGFNGDADVGGGRGQTISALAVASAKFDPATFCVLALATGVTGIDVNGNSGSPPPFAGCSLGSRGNISCNQPQGADSAYAVGTASGCSTNNHPSQPIGNFADPYSSLASKIPANLCGTAKANYPGVTLAANSTINLSATPTRYCGNVTLAGNVTIQGNGVIVIYNGGLNPGNFTLTSGISGGVPAGVTIIFAGSTVSGLNPSHVVEPNSKGALNIAAPKSGDWSGVAIYTDPSLTTNVDYTQNGANATAWNVTGLIYMPKSAVRFNGEVSKALNGSDCFALVVSTLRSNGGVRFTEHQTECAQAGLTPPKGGTAQRQALVQ